MDPCIGSNSPVRSKFQRPALGDTEDEYSCRLTSVRAPLASDLEASVGRRRRTGGGMVVRLGGAARVMGRAGGLSWMRGGRRPVGSRDRWEDATGDRKSDWITRFSYHVTGQ
jgi:hypothetical protein